MKKKQKNKKVLIIGERFADNRRNSFVFKYGQSAKRVRKWFNKTNYNDMIEIADMINAFPNYHDYNTLMNYIIDKNYKIIFLLGRVARRVLFSNTKKTMIIINCNKRKFILLPHPSGRNFSCNHKDKKIKKLIKRTLYKNES